MFNCVLAICFLISISSAAKSNITGPAIGKCENFDIKAEWFPSICNGSLSCAPEGEITEIKKCLCLACLVTENVKLQGCDSDKEECDDLSQQVFWMSFLFFALHCMCIIGCFCMCGAACCLVLHAACRLPAGLKEPLPAAARNTGP